MTISLEVSAINNKIEQKKAQQNLDSRTDTITALSSGNAGK